MVEVHYVPTPNGHKVTIMLEEIEWPYSLISYDIRKGEHLTSDFRRINPNCRLPAIVDHAPDDSDQPLAIFESGAILVHLAEKSGKLLPRTSRKRAVVMQWLMWQMSGLGPMHGQAHHFTRYCREANDYALNRYLNEARRLLDVMDRRLRETEFLADEYSIADISCWPWVRASHWIGIPVRERENLWRWYLAVGNRAAVIKVIGAPVDETIVDDLTVHKQTLTDAEWSNLFGQRMLAAPKA